MKRIFQTMTLLTVFILLQSCSSGESTAKSLEQIYEEEGLPVRVEILGTAAPAASYATSAVLTGIEESTASASVADQVDHIHYQVGDSVQEDDVVITFPTDNPAAQYTQAKVHVEHMRTTLERMKTLYENGGISRQDLDNTAAQCRVAEANWDAAQQAVEVRAPIAGLITRMDVQKSDDVNPGDALFTVARINRLKAQIWVSENRINDIHPGDQALAIWNGTKITGHVSQVDISLNSRMQAFGVQIEFENQENNVRPGINADIQILSARDSSVLMTARKNLVKTENGYFAYILKTNHALKQPVKIGRSLDLDVEILQGLSAGDTILTEGVSLVENGQLVRVVE